jgi:hypothetical protein
MVHFTELGFHSARTGRSFQLGLVAYFVTIRSSFCQKLEVHSAFC